MHSGKVATTKYVNDAVILIGVVEHGPGDNQRIGLAIIEHSFLRLISQCPKPLSPLQVIAVYQYLTNVCGCTNVAS